MAEVAVAMIPLLTMFLSAVAVADTTRPPCPGGEVLRAEQLAGVVLLTDLLDRLTGITSTSIDQFDRRPHVGGGPAGAAGWVILIDGVPAATGPFGESAVHLLPVEVEEIASVTWCPGATLAAGRFAPAGRLEIATSRVTRSDDAYVVASRVANETGDPGPRRYFSGAVANVDKIGPDIWTALAGRSGTLSARFERRYPTDPATSIRNRAVSGRFPAVRYGALGSSVASPGAVRFDVGGTYASDLWYDEAAGRELPVSRAGAQVAATTGRPIGPFTMGVRAAPFAWTLQRPDIPDSVSSGFDPGWWELGGTVDAELRQVRSGSWWAAGLHLEGRTASGRGLDRGDAGLVRVWAQRAGAAGGRFRRRNDVAIVAGGQHVGIEGAVVVERLFAGGSVAITIARDDHLPEERTGPLMWRARGFTGLAGIGARYHAAPTIAVATEWSGRLDATARVAGVALHAAGALHDFRNLTIEHGSFLPDSTTGVTGETRAVGGQGGRLVLLTAGGAGRVGRARWRTAYRYQRDIVGDPAFREVWQSVPVHLLQAGVSIQHDRTLTSFLALRARSGGYWAAFEAFEDLENADGHRFSARTPSAVLVDVSVRKSFAGRGLTLTALAQNLLNVEERTHPLGASLALRLWLQAAVRL